jgi:hypothetical protein
MAGVQEYSTEEFLRHETKKRGEFLKGEWKENPGYIDVWLHRKRPFASVWQHQIPRIDVRDDPNTGSPRRVIMPGSYRCLEDEREVLIDQYRRDKDTGRRKSPPVVCPICLFIEWVRGKVWDDELHWLQPVFDFDVGSEKTRQVIRAAGMWGGYKLDRLSDAQKEELSDAGILPSESWRESIVAGLKYVLCVVDEANPARGVQIMKESQLVGDKIKQAIAKEIKRHPKDKAQGDPVRNPYALRIEYREKELSPMNKYDAFRIEVDLTPQVEELITKTDAPDISMMEGNYSPKTLQAQLERVCQLDAVPWDDFFTGEAEKLLSSEQEEPKKKKQEQEPRREQPTRSDAVGRTIARKEEARSGRPESKVAPKAAPKAEPNEEMCECDCGKLMRASDTKCPHCGLEYEVDAEPAPSPPPLRKRSEVARERASASPSKAAPKEEPRSGRPESKVAPKASAKAETLPAPPAADDEGFGDFGDDEIPFVTSEVMLSALDRIPKWERW